MARISPTLCSCILAFLLLTAGCSSLLETRNETVAPSANTSTLPPSSYQISLSQPDARSDFIRMDTDVFNAGEVVEFVVVNDDLIPLECSRTPPDFRVRFQTSSGRWVAKMGPETPVKGNTSFLQKGESTQVYRFVSAGWEPGRYRVVSDCGVERDILIRALPAPVPTGTPCLITRMSNATKAYLTINTIPAQKSGQPFTISGTTNLPAGTGLYYAIFSIQTCDTNRTLAKEGSFTTVVEEGSCGINTWNAMGEIQASGDFFIGIEDKFRAVTAVGQFSVSP